MLHKWTLALAAVAVLLPTGAASQVELGIDGGFQLTLPEQGDNVTAISLPVRWVRIGFAVSERVQIEPTLGFNHASTDEGSGTSLGLFPSLVYNFRSPSSGGAYVRIGGGLAFTDVDTDFGNEGTTQFGVGSGVGVRIQAVEALLVRLEAAFDHWFEGDDVEGFNALRLLVGLSFFAG